MAHIVVGIHDPDLRLMVREVLQDEGHLVTVAEDFWQALALMRTALQALVVLYFYDGYAADVVHDATTLKALAAGAASGELTRHAYVQMSWGRGALPPPVQALAEQVIVETVPDPFEVEGLLAAVNRAAARLAARDRN